MTSTVNLIEDLAEIGTCLDGELERRDYRAARISANRLTDIAGTLCDLIQATTDPDERARLVDLHDGAAERWIKADKILRVHEAELAEKAADEAWYVDPDPDATAVAALLHWIRRDRDAGRLLVGACTSVALVGLQERFAGRIGAVNAANATLGRQVWDVTP